MIKEIILFILLLAQISLIILKVKGIVASSWLIVFIPSIMILAISINIIVTIIAILAVIYYYERKDDSIIQKLLRKKHE